MNEIIPLVSFPKSGNTWLRFLLANIYKSDETGIDFNNINDYTKTSFREAGLIDGNLLVNQGPIFVKQHGNYRDLSSYTFNKAIYLHRDGLDTLYSYWRFTEAQSPGLFHSVDDFADYYWRYCGHWGEHIISWMDNAKGKHDILELRYDSLKNDTLNEMKRVVRFIGLDVEEDKILRAIESSSADNMKKMKSSDVFMNAKNKNFHFVRSTKIGEGDSGLTDYSKNRFLSEKINRKMLNKEYGYDLNIYENIEKHPDFRDKFTFQIKKAIYKLKNV